MVFGSGNMMRSIAWFKVFCIKKLYAVWILSHKSFCFCFALLVMVMVMVTAMVMVMVMVFQIGLE